MSGLTSIVIPTFNQLEYTRWCVASIRFFTTEPYELIVVDNGSSDGTREYLQTQKDIRPILNEMNGGFAKACNQGIRQAAGDFVLLLNNDTAVAAGWLRNMINCLESNPAIGIVGPRTNFAKGPQSLQVDYANMDEMFAFSCQFNAKPDPSKWFELEMAVGFCMLVKRQVIESVGLLDERFGIGFFEDDDYCRRVRLKEFRIMCAGDTFVHHFGSRSFIGNKIDRDRLVQENWRKYAAKWKL